MAKSRPSFVTLTDIAKEQGCSIQAVSQFLRRKGVQPVNPGGGPCTHFYSLQAVERAYDKKRQYYNRRSSR